MKLEYFSSDNSLFGQKSHKYNAQTRQYCLFFPASVFPLKSQSLRLWLSNWKTKTGISTSVWFFDNYIPCLCLHSAWQYGTAKCMKIFWPDPLKSIWHKSLEFSVWFISHSISSQMSVWPWCRFLIMANESVQVFWCAEFKPVLACWFHIIFPYSLRSSWGDIEQYSLIRQDWNVKLEYFYSNISLLKQQSHEYNA